MKTISHYCATLFSSKPPIFDIDGQAWAPTSALDKIEPTLLVGGTVALCNTFYAVATGPYGILAEAFFSATSLTLGAIGMSILDASPAFSYKKGLSQYPITTAAHTTPLAKQLAGHADLLSKVHCRKLAAKDKLKFTASYLAITCAFSYKLFDALPSVSFLSMAFAMPLFKYGADYLRCKGLLDGKYAFCSKASAETKKPNPSPFSGHATPQFS